MKTLTNQKLKKYTYQVGGCLPADAPTYITRQADQDFYDGLKNGEFCYVLSARQMGKSSLLVRTMRHLEDEGFACAVIDLSSIGSTETTQKQLYAGIIRVLADKLGFKPHFDLKTWWQNHSLLSPAQHLNLFIEEVLLTRISQSIVIFIDESDALPQLAQDFFQVIRACYNQRSENAAYKRLTFGILGVSSLGDLMTDKKRTPFNIGRAIELNGFQLYEAMPLAQGMVTKKSTPENLMKTVLDWTGGQPFLTQKLCKIISESEFSQQVHERQEVSKGGTLSEGQELAYIEQLVKTKIVDDWESQDDPMHLRYIRDRIMYLEEGQYIGRLLGLYQQILSSKESKETEFFQKTQLTSPYTGIPADDSPEQLELRLSGLVVLRKSKLFVYNRIYEMIFDKDWCDRTIKELRPYAEDLRAWDVSGHQDDSRLLWGQALQDAKAWAEGKRLSDQDHHFLEACQNREKKTLANTVKLQRKRQFNWVLAILLTAAIAYSGQEYLTQKQALENAEIALQQKEQSLEKAKIASQQLALKNTEVALRQSERESILTVVKTLSDELVDELTQIPTILPRILERNIALWNKIHALLPENKRALQEKLSNLSRLGDNWLLLGETEKALVAYQQGIEILKKQVQNKPKNAWAKRNLLISFNTLGDAQLQLGNTQAALKAYQQSLEISEKIATEDPNGSQALHDLIVCLDNLGHVQLQRGNTQTALKAYQQSLEIRQQLNTEKDSQAPHDLSVSWDNIGHVQLQRSNLEMALNAYQKSFDLRERVADEQNSFQAQRDLSVSLDNIAQVRRQQGNIPAALKIYQQSLSKRQLLAIDEPLNYQIQRDLSVSWDNIGQVQLQLENTEAAINAYQKSLSIRETLADESKNFQAQHDLIDSFKKLGDVQLQLGNTVLALEAYQSSLRSSKPFAKNNPTNWNAQRDLMFSFDKIGDVQLERYNTVEALKAYHESLKISKEIVADDPENRKAQHDLLFNYYKRGQIQNSLQKQALALKAYQNALVIAEDLAARDADNQQAQKELTGLQGLVVKNLQ